MAEPPADVPLQQLLASPQGVPPECGVQEVVLDMMIPFTLMGTFIVSSSSSPLVSPGLGLRSHLLTRSCRNVRVAFSCSRLGKDGR